MLNALKSLPDDPAELRSVSALLMAEVQSLTYQNEKLKAELHGHRKARFGSKSESMDQLALDLLDDEEIEAAAQEQKNEADTDADEADKPAKRKHSRKPLPDHLDRQDEVLSPGEDCGGALRQVGEDVTEELEYIPSRLIVRRIIRPRMACTCCEVFAQAPLPSRPIERGRPAQAFWRMFSSANTAIICRLSGNPRSSPEKRSSCTAPHSQIGWDAAPPCWNLWQIISASWSGRVRHFLPTIRL